MNFSLLSLGLTGLAYLSFLFALAHATERNWIPRRWARHPLVYTLSLGVYAGAWAVYGAIGMAYEYGFGYLAYYLGICGAFLLAPVLLHPVLRITRSYQLTSLADLFAFRYRSQWAGTLVTLCSAAAILSLLSLQIQVVTTAVEILLPETSRAGLGTLFALAVMLFAILFGARRDSGQERHEGLVMAIAFDGLFKLAAMLVLGGVVLFAVFGGPAELSGWLEAQAPRISALERRLGDGAWRAMLLMSFAAALVMPHMFHITFTENPGPRALARASWGLPLYLLLLALPVPIILWSGIQAGAPTSPEFYPLGLARVLEMPGLAILTYLAGLSAASGLMIVLTLALSGMVLNHVVLPLRPPREGQNIYRWLQWVKRVLIALIILLALAFHEWLGGRQQLATLGILALAGVLQLLPGALGVIYWPEGNRNGVIAGLLAGIAAWLLTLVLPLTFGVNVLAELGLTLPFPIDREHLHIYIFSALTLNISVFALTSMLTATSMDEASAAQACSLGALSRPRRRELTAASSAEFAEQLKAPLGEEVAQREMQRALTQLNLPEQEYRPYQLRRLRDQIEINLSGLLGPGVARDIVKRHLGFKPLAGNDPAHDIQYVERTLEDYQSRLTGLAGELDSLRRHYRQILQNLPIAACSIGSDGEVLMWNQAMTELTGIAADTVTGARLHSLPEPWSELLADFAAGDDLHRYKHRMDVRGQPHWFNLHKSAIDGPEHPEGGSVLLVEDQTETRLLEDELIHSERLASIGRLAAGVAHEVGNPVTGISSLAQNLKLETDQPEALETADEILRQTERISRILQSLMNFARSGNYQPAPPHEPARIRRCVQEAINLLSLGEKTREIIFDNQCPPALEVVGDEQRLVQVFVNLLGNARDASPDGGRIRIAGKRDGYSAIIEVVDEGSGIPADQLDHIFEPFYTTKGPNQGTGLGLSLVYSIIEEHYGTIQVASPASPTREGGTRVTLKLPAHEAKPDRPAEQEGPV